MTNILFDYKLYIIVFLLIGKSSLSRFGIPIDIPFSAMYATFFVIIIFFILNKKNKLYKFKVDYLDISIIIFYIYIIYSVFLSPDIETAIFEYCIPNIFILMSILLIRFTVNNSEKLDKIIMYFFILSIFMAITGIPKIGTGRVTSIIGGGPNTYYKFMLQGYCISSYYISINKYKTLNILSIALFIFMGLNTGSRGFIIGLIAIILIQNLLNIKKMDFKRISILFGLILFGCFIISNESIKLYLTSKIPVLDRVWIVFDAKALANSTSGGARIDLINNALDLFKKGNLFEVLFGFGPYSTSIVSILKIYPHNLFIEVLVEYGIVGFILLINIFSGWLFKSYHIYKKNISLPTKQKSMIICLNLVLIVHFIGGMFSGYIIDSRLIFIFIILVNILYNQVSVKVTKDTSDIL